MGEQVRARARVTGRVQGVFFRQSCAEHARALGLTGWVCNEPDGAVTVEAQGEQRAVEDLLEWCAKGPPSARVDAVRVDRTSVVDVAETTFRVR